MRLVRKLRAELGTEHGTVKRVADVAEQLGYGVESVRGWVRQADIDDGVRAGVSTEEADQIKVLEQEVRELRRANAILRSASTCERSRSQPPRYQHLLIAQDRLNICRRPGLRSVLGRRRSRPACRYTIVRYAQRRGPPDPSSTASGTSSIAAQRALDDWLAYASRSRLEPFVKLARTVRRFRTQIEATIEWRFTNAIAESNNASIGRIRANARGFQNPEAFITMIMLDRAGLTPDLPWAS